MSNPIYITVIIHCKPTRVEDCLTHALKARDATRREPGCLSFVVTQSNQDASKIILLESYEDHASFETIFETLGHRRLMNTRKIFSST